jgi:hypothetical protein
VRNDEDGTTREPEVGLDDLFGAPRPQGWSSTRGGPVPGGRWLLGRLFFAVALAAVIYGLLYLFRLTVPYPLLVFTIFIVTLMKYLLSRIGVRPLPRQLTGRGLWAAVAGSGAGQRGTQEPDGWELAVSGWTDRLSHAGRDAAVYRGSILPRLGELADERLRLRHGVTRASDPRRAREMMGEHLWRMLHDLSSATPRDMALLVDRIEEL